MPLEVLSAAAIVCERFLLEKDEVFSAIRIIDVFLVPKEIPQGLHMEVSFLILIRAKGEGEARLALKLIDPVGKERKVAADKSNVPDRVVATKKFDDPEIPTGISLAVHLNVEPKPLGTYCLRLELDGSEKASAYFTLIPQPSPDRQS
jgi:hypothetical protein